MKRIYLATAREWRAWLRRNHDSESGVWLIFYKKTTGIPAIEYESAVEEALCYGWIDSTVKRIDDKRYARKFTPRTATSSWSELNRQRAARLIESGRMTGIGLAAIDAARESGRWDKPDRPAPRIDMAPEFQNALRKNRIAMKHFEQLAPSHQKRYIMWVGTAKRADTRAKRIIESIELLANGKRLGMK